MQGFFDFLRKANAKVFGRSDQFFKEYETVKFIAAIVLSLLAADLWEWARSPAEDEFASAPPRTLSMELAEGTYVFDNGFDGGSIVVTMVPPDPTQQRPVDVDEKKFQELIYARFVKLQISYQKSNFSTVSLLPKGFSARVDAENRPVIELPSIGCRARLEWATLKPARRIDSSAAATGTSPSSQGEAGNGIWQLTIRSIDSDPDDTKKCPLG